MVQGAVYDAVNAIGPKQHRPYCSRRVRVRRRRSTLPSQRRRTTCSRTSSRRHPSDSVPAVARHCWRRSPRSTTHRSPRSTTTPPRSRASRSGTRRPRPCSTRGWATDGSGRPSGCRTPAAGHWQPLIDRRRAQILDPTPWVADVKPFFIQSSVAVPQRATARADSRSGRPSSTRSRPSAGPPARRGMTALPEQTYIAKWWQSAPGLSWNEVARQLIARNDLDAADAARLLALQNMSGADAAINCWNDKYHFDFWRPWNAIPRALEDGNAATDRRRGLDAAHHRAVSRVGLGAQLPRRRTRHRAAPVLRRRRRQAASRSRASSSNPGGSAVRTFATFSQPLAELIEARIWAGLHYRSADVAGQLLGTNVAKYGDRELLPAGGPLTITPDAQVD